jgi:hypothetical protein
MDVWIDMWLDGFIVSLVDIGGCLYEWEIGGVCVDVGEIHERLLVRVYMDFWIDMWVNIFMDGWLNRVEWVGWSKNGLIEHFRWLRLSNTESLKNICFNSFKVQQLLRIYIYHLLWYTKSPQFWHTVYLCDSCDFHNKQRLFPQTSLTGWFS